ncbi:MAG: c-type cytochrome [Campylobacterota bacterium]|nr:c-type cytochrome [Campylobacterota bacterium]
MRRIMISLIAGAVSLMAAEGKVDGEKVFEKACASCHIKIISKPELMKVMKSVKAPPMIEVSSQLKNNIKIVEDIDDEIHRAVVIAFIKDYVLYPDLDKSMCTGAALDRFGLMPSLKGKLSEEELNAVAAWVYDFYVGKKF